MSALSRCRAVCTIPEDFLEPVLLPHCLFDPLQTPNTLTINSGILSRSVQVHRPFHPLTPCPPWLPPSPAVPS